MLLILPRVARVQCRGKLPPSCGALRQPVRPQQLTLRCGDYVLYNFPFRESRGPGPSPHVVLCATTGREGNTRFAIVFYTTFQIDFHGSRRPRPYLFVNETRALEL